MLDLSRKPFVYLLDNEYAGFEVELMYGFCREYGYRPVFEAAQWTSGVAGLKEGKYDVVSCGIYMSYQGADDDVTATNQNTDKPDLTSTTMLRLVLDYAGSVEEAVELISQYDLHDSANTSFHYMIADSTGKSAILEWVTATDETDTDGTKRELKVYYNDDDAALGENEASNEFQYITNFIVTPDYYTNESDMKGLDRYTEIQNKINPDGTNTEGVMTKEAALDVLKTVGRRKWDSRNGESDANGITVWSALYDLTNKTVTWVSNEEFDNAEAVFTFDFSYLN